MGGNAVHEAPRHWFEEVVDTAAPLLQTEFFSLAGATHEAGRWHPQTRRAFCDARWLPALDRLVLDSQNEVGEWLAENRPDVFWGIQRWAGTILVPGLRDRLGERLRAASIENESLACLADRRAEVAELTGEFCYWNHIGAAAGRPAGPTETEVCAALDEGRVVCGLRSGRLVVY